MLPVTTEPETRVENTPDTKLAVVPVVVVPVREVKVPLTPSTLVPFTTVPVTVVLPMTVTPEIIAAPRVQREPLFSLGSSNEALTKQTGAFGRSLLFICPIARGLD